MNSHLEAVGERVKIWLYIRAVILTTYSNSRVVAKHKTVYKRRQFYFLRVFRVAFSIIFQTVVIRPKIFIFFIKKRLKNTEIYDDLRS